MIQTNQKEYMADTNNIKSDFQKIYNDLTDAINLKVEKKEINNSNNRIFEELEKKVRITHILNI